MRNFSIRTLFIVGVSALAFLLTIPNFLSQETQDNLPGWMKPIPLGLDLKGGAYLLMDVDMDVVISDRMAQLKTAVRDAMVKDTDERIRFQSLRISNHTITFSVREDDQLSTARKRIRAMDPDLEVDTDGSKLTVYYSEAGMRKIKNDAIDRSIEIVRRRVDALGTREPSIQRQGERRIVIQLPGISDPARIKDLIGTTAKMTFHRVAEDAAPNAAGVITLPYNDNPSYTLTIYEAVAVSGEYLTDSRVSYDMNNRPVVTTTFNGVGARLFGNLTASNIGKRFAIVLDGKILSAPVVQEAIMGGHGQISGGFNVKEAQDLAMLLRSGALPAPLTVVEERTVGPGLGADSIRDGTIACVLGLVLVMLVMVIIYGIFGFFVDLVLVLNMMLILGVLGLFGATLTLPGIAGIVLTIGMAVDANVLIFERMREEGSNGLPILKTINAAYDRALVTILDANITTLVASLILFQFGTGPIRGFAVTLAIGVLTSLFSSIVVSRFFIDMWAKNHKKLPLIKQKG